MQDEKRSFIADQIFFPAYTESTNPKRPKAITKVKYNKKAYRTILAKQAYFLKYSTWPLSENKKADRNFK